MRRLGFIGLFLLLPQGWAHNVAPLAQLTGVRPCIEPSSVQLVLEGAPEIDTARVKRDVYAHLSETLKKKGISYDEACSSSPSFVLLGIYARFLDPESYIGFPPSSYTYLTTGQLGRFSRQPTLETVLSPALYATSMSEIFQAADADALIRQLVTMGNLQVDDFTRHWLEANAVPLRVYLGFAALAVGLLALRLLPLLRLSRARLRS